MQKGNTRNGRGIVGCEFRLWNCLEMQGWLISSWYIRDRVNQKLALEMYRTLEYYSITLHTDNANPWLHVISIQKEKTMVNRENNYTKASPFTTPLAYCSTRRPAELMSFSCWTKKIWKSNVHRTLILGIQRISVSSGKRITVLETETPGNVRIRIWNKDRVGLKFEQVSPRTTLDRAYKSVFRIGFPAKVIAARGA